MTAQEESKNRRIAILATVGVHALMLILFFFLVAWRTPNPPLPEIGLVMNFGTSDQGTGNIQPKDPVGSEGTQPEEPNQPEAKEEVVETPPPVESKVEEQPVATQNESPVAIPEKKKEEVKQPEKPVVKPEPKKEEPVKPKPDPSAAYKPATPKAESDNTTEDAKAGTASSHGDDKNKTGDKGNPQGSPDANAQYGKPGGGGGGPSLDLAGWQWDQRPAPAVPPGESGRIVFEIVVNSDGEIEGIKTIERGVSIEAEKACRKAIEKLTFTKTGTNVPELSKGTITFVIRSN